MKVDILSLGRFSLLACFLLRWLSSGVLANVEHVKEGTEYFVTEDMHSHHTCLIKITILMRTALLQNM